MFQHGSVEKIREHKQLMQHQIQKQRLILEEFDQSAIRTKKNLGGDSVDTLPDEDLAAWTQEYNELTNQLNEAKKELDDLRLLGDEFNVISVDPRIGTSEPKIIEVTHEGQILICDVARTDKPIVPEDMSSYSYFRISEVKTEVDVGGENAPIFEIRFSRMLKGIDQLIAMRPTTPGVTLASLIPSTSWLASQIRSALTPNSSQSSVSMVEEAPITPANICYFEFEWKPAEGSRQVRKNLFYCSTFEFMELEEVLRCHLLRHKQRFVKLVQKLKDIWRESQVAYDSNNHQHEKLLYHLWEVINPEVPLSERITNDWKKIGFQGKDPATDFRGMGIHGLKNLIYFAEHYPAEVRAMLNNGSEFPWASAGINLSHFLFTLVKLSEPMMDIPPSHYWESPTNVVLIYATNALFVEDDLAFEEVYCQIFILFDAIWRRMNAKYMDFPNVMIHLRKIWDELVHRRPLSIVQLRGLVSVYSS